MQIKLLIILLTLITIVTLTRGQSLSCYRNVSSGNDSVQAGCTYCGITVFSNYVYKSCYISCETGSYQGGYLFCCTTDYCNYNYTTSMGSLKKMSCYTCSNCITTGSVESECDYCATTIYSGYTEKTCASTCTNGTYNGGNRSCCRTNYCNSYTPTGYLSCYQNSSSGNDSVVTNCAYCGITVFSNYVTKNCYLNCVTGSYQGGYLYCCTSNYCNNNSTTSMLSLRKVSCYTCSNCITTGSVESGCNYCATTVYAGYTEKTCASTCTDGTYNGGNRSCCSSNLCNSYTTTYGSALSCYKCSYCSKPFQVSSATNQTGCTYCGNEIYTSYTVKSCLSGCTAGKYNGGYLYCCNTNYCNYADNVSIILSLKSSLIGFTIFAALIIVS